MTKYERTARVVITHIRTWRGCTNSSDLEIEVANLIQNELDRPEASEHCVLCDASAAPSEAHTCRGRIKLDEVLPPEKIRALRCTCGGNLRYLGGKSRWTLGIGRTYECQKCACLTRPQFPKGHDEARIEGEPS